MQGSVCNSYCRSEKGDGIGVESTIASKGRTTLPRAAREALGVGPGDRVRYFIPDDDVRILPVRPVARLFGILKYDGPPVTLKDMERAIAEGARGE